MRSITTHAASYHGDLLLLLAGCSERDLALGADLSGDELGVHADGDPSWSLAPLRRTLRCVSYCVCPLVAHSASGVVVCGGAPARCPGASSAAISVGGSASDAISCGLFCRLTRAGNGGQTACLAQQLPSIVCELTRAGNGGQTACLAQQLPRILS